MPVVARPVKRSGWKLSTVVAAGGGALPAEMVLVPNLAASALGGANTVKRKMKTANRLSWLIRSEAMTAQVVPFSNHLLIK